jgi:hypothetical protein
VCADCPSEDVAKLEKAEAEVALDDASASGAWSVRFLFLCFNVTLLVGTKRAATPTAITNPEIKRPRLGTDASKDLEPALVAS